MCTNEKCCTLIQSCIHSRRCFMTGEHCSKQPNIQRERKKLHTENKKKIRAFVIMNFSDMSDIVYKWRIKPFIESLSKYFYIDNDKLYCRAREWGEEETTGTAVKEIEVVRSDSDPASNYVVCSRICQQMQIADLVVVDVTSQNANVFYEFGMAVALGKMILPICYSESFYKMVIPKTLMENRVNGKIIDSTWEIIEHHIGFYPWRKDLFEYYGIQYKKNDSQTKYLDFDEIKNPIYGFSDIQYDRFPYHEKVNEDKEKIGKKIYDLLSKEYNYSKYNDNTLVVYTMDGFLNEEQAGRCIVNFYTKIVSKMKTQKCFCGERVGVLVQGNVIPESEKDVREKLDIAYSVGEIIQIGTNQATYLAAEERIKSNDNWPVLNASALSSQQKAEIDRFTRIHVTNRTMRIYPNNPVFVDRMKNLVHRDLVSPIENAFYLYYVMLRTLQYTNEIVVDISNNCLQSLFWLGAAHGLDVHAITVMHQKTDSEKIYDEKQSRYVFDVAGLWMAILQKNDIEGFYLQLAAAQSGIERHSKLMLPNREYSYYKTQLTECFFSSDPESNDKFSKLREEKDAEESISLESYYRDRFWMPVLGYNKLSIYLSHKNQPNDDEETWLGMSKWDFDTVSVLSQYLSKRKIIGEYSLVSLEEASENQPVKDINFICVGSKSQPLNKSLPRYIYEQIICNNNDNYSNRENINIVHERDGFKGKKGQPYDCEKTYKGFKRVGINDNGEITLSKEGIFAHQPHTKTCANCRIFQQPNEIREGSEKFFDSETAETSSTCLFTQEGRHVEIAQLILWRENAKTEDEHNYFRVGIIGSSGPATYALSLLLVSEMQVEKYFTFDTDTVDIKKEKMLCKLQHIIRRKFIDVFYDNLGQSIKEILPDSENSENITEGSAENYSESIKYSVISYLKTVLYRYFLPFLSEIDIERIYNGMYMFINSMKTVKIGPFAHIADNTLSDRIVQAVSKTLDITLKDFRGVEVFYEIAVQHDLKNPVIEKDTRQVRGIKMLQKEIDEDFYINYFFINTNKDKNQKEELS